MPHSFPNFDAKILSNGPYEGPEALPSYCPKQLEALEAALNLEDVEITTRTPDPDYINKWPDEQPQIGLQIELSLDGDESLLSCEYALVRLLDSVRQARLEFDNQQTKEQ